MQHWYSCCLKIVFITLIATVYPSSTEFEPTHPPPRSNATLLTPRSPLEILHNVLNMRIVPQCHRRRCNRILPTAVVPCRSLELWWLWHPILLRWCLLRYTTLQRPKQRIDINLWSRCPGSSSLLLRLLLGLETGQQRPQIIIINRRSRRSRSSLWNG